MYCKWNDAITIGQMYSNSDCMSNLHVSQTDVRLLNSFSQHIAECYTFNRNNITRTIHNWNGTEFSVGCRLNSVNVKASRTEKCTEFRYLIYVMHKHKNTTHVFVKYCQIRWVVSAIEQIMYMIIMRMCTNHHALGRRSQFLGGIAVSIIVFIIIVGVFVVVTRRNVECQPLHLPEILSRFI